MIPNVLEKTSIPNEILASANVTKLQNHISNAGTVANMYRIIEAASPYFEFTILNCKSGLEIRLNINDSNLNTILNLPLD